MNESGEESFYQYDTKDETYQRYPVTDVKEKSTSSSTTLIDKVKTFPGSGADCCSSSLGGYFNFDHHYYCSRREITQKKWRTWWILRWAWIHREFKRKSCSCWEKSRKQFKGYQDEEDDFVDDFEDEEETDDEDPDEYEEYEDDDEYGEDDYDTYEDDSDEYEDDFEEYDDDEYEDDDYDDEYDEYEDYDDEEEDDVPEYQPKRRSSAREEKDSYDVDFIDL